MKIGYNTNGLAHHEPLEALSLLADNGYESVAITVDHYFLNPRSESRHQQIGQVQAFLQQRRISSVIETGARFLLDPKMKHYPTLMDPDEAQADRRIEYLKYCIDVAAQLKSDCVSIWSGRKPVGSSFSESLDRLARNLEPVLQHAEERGMDIGFEPEPDMLVDTTGRFERLLHLIDSPRLKMTMDIGHLFCLSEVPIVSYIEKWQSRIINVHIEDMMAGIHEHLMFGDGQIYFPPVIEALVRADYQHGLHVELPRHGHNAAEVVRQSYQFLKPIIDDALSSQNLD